ncbi:Calreticulin [Phytophthora nicotianae]|uniref:Calreticulin n=1 Tax=Phytophthora nicotianae TaxID=4792 RepID=A0A0W8DQL1_PHYNI|nr:Calreticulin [Phytophthora nicotianae]
MGRGEYYRNKYGGGRGGGRGGRGGRGRGRGDSEGFDRGHSGHYNDRPRTPLTTASWERLGYVLQEIHNRNYGAYHELERVFEFQSNDLHFALEFDHIQGDPYASPSRSHVTVSATSAAFPAEMYQDKIRNVALTFTLPNYGVITGMGIPQGVTLFVGGGFHGKSTVLKALEVGVYNHVPSDGREFVVMDPNAAKIRSEDSRSVVCTDISAFIDNLPFKQDTTRFSTADASGSTSQAANIIEALEVGATTLLIDEDTCATNFMIRDWKMQQLVAKDKEPITPFISKVQALYKQRGVSSVLVIGGAGDYFSVADHVIMMDSYEPRDVTTEAKKIASEHGEIRQDAEFGEFKSRIPLGRGFEVNGKVVSRGLGKIQYGEVDLDLSAVEQIVEPSQVRTIADAIQKTRSFMDGKCTLEEVLIKLEGEMDRTGSLDVVGFHKKSGFYTRPRKLELAAAINRLRTATMTQ